MLLTEGVEAQSNIILAEDNNALRRSLQLLLLGQGLAVRSFASSSGVLADPSIRDSDCLVADYRMPELDGIGLLFALRERGWKGRSALITGYLSPELEEKALAAGFEIVVGKPISRQTLLDTVARLLAESLDQRPFHMPIVPS